MGFVENRQRRGFGHSGGVCVSSFALGGGMMSVWQIQIAYLSPYPNPSNNMNKQGVRFGNTTAEGPKDKLVKDAKSHMFRTLKYRFPVK